MSSPMTPFESQNVKDDDGSVIDSFFIESDTPPDLKFATQPIPVDVLEDPVKNTRIISKDELIDYTWTTPYAVLPADANRKSLNVYVYSPTAVATDGVRLSDENGTIYTAGKLLHNGTIELTHHTGALWVLPCGAAAGNTASAPVRLQVWSVTS